VITAHDGFEALAELRSSLPEVVVSDLELPNMSGFELLSVVRIRFPGVAVIARSSEFFPAAVPEGVLADRYLRKDANADFELKEAIKQLLTEVPLRATQPKVELAPAWLPKNSRGYAVITCPACLRSSSVRVSEADFGTIRRDACLHCGSEIQYRLDKTVSDSQEPPTMLQQMQERVKITRRTVESSTIIQNSNEKTK
jgi:CheY-like chemotaxis protein